MTDMAQDPVNSWREGTLDECLEFIETREGVTVEAKYEPNAPAGRQYSYRELWPPRPFREIEQCDLCDGPFRAEEEITRIGWESNGEDGPGSTLVHYDCAERHPMKIRDRQGT